MATKSGFTVRFDGVDAGISMDGMGYIRNGAAWNSGKRIHITDVQMIDVSGFNSDLTNVAGNQGILSLDRISAYSGGTEVTTVYKMDTGASALPSQVKMMLAPASVTVDSTLRRFGNAASFTILQTMSWYASMRAPGPMDRNDNSGRTAEGMDVWHIPSDGDIEPIVLREGEGIAVDLRAYGVIRAYHWSIFVRVVSTGNVYRYKTSMAIDPYNIGDALWCLHNASGSGVVLQVMVVQFPTMGESNAPRYRLCKLRGEKRSLGDATDVTPIKRDTAADLTGVEARVGPFLPDINLEGTVQSYWDYQIVPVPIAQQQQASVFRHWLDAGPGWMESGVPGVQGGMFEQANEVWPGERRRGASGQIDDDIILLPGECLGIVGGGNGLVECGEGAVANFEVQGYIETDGGTYPVEDDVRNGVDYGPTGAEFDGDLVLPAVADVKSGVTYGADGTEYTGTYSPGGGGIKPPGVGSPFIKGDRP